jgi:23S rRNA maturation-related 3'-5' exoribonuclease YhaM
MNILFRRAYNTGNLPVLTSKRALRVTQCMQDYLPPACQDQLNEINGRMYTHMNIGHYELSHSLDSLDDDHAIRVVNKLKERGFVVKKKPFYSIRPSNIHISWKQRSPNTLEEDIYYSVTGCVIGSACGLFLGTLLFH